MAYPFAEQDGVEQTEAEEFRLARDYAGMIASGAWKDLVEVIETSVAAAQDTLYKNASQDPQIAFGLLKRWQERGAMRDFIYSRVRQFENVLEELKEQHEHSTDDTRTYNQ